MDDDEVIVQLRDHDRFNRAKEFANAFRDRKGCRHQMVRDPEFVQSIVSVLEQIPKPERK